MNWTLIENPDHRGKSKIHLSLSIPTKTGTPKFCVTVPTVISKNFGFDDVYLCSVFGGSDDHRSRIWIKPDPEGQRPVKWGNDVFMIEIEPVAGMVLRRQSELVDYEPGPENLGVTFGLPDSLFADGDGDTINLALHEKPDGLALNGLALVMGGKQIRLTRSEATIMNLLFLRFGRVVRKTQLHDELYQLDPNGGAEDKTIDVYVHHIRAKITAARMGIAIITHRGIGYEMRNAIA